MPLQAAYCKFRLNFTFEAGTSRGVLTYKDTYFIKVYKTSHPDIYGLGEAGPLLGLSLDDRRDFEAQLHQFCKSFREVDLPDKPEQITDIIKKAIPDAFPSIRFGWETALLDLLLEGKRQMLPNSWSRPPFQPIPINGLVWMGNSSFMREQIQCKLEQGFSCIKMKIGAIDFESEVELLAYIRKHFSKEEITLRVDANGAFSPGEAMKKLEALAKYDIHSIEQPIRPGQWDQMQYLCQSSPLPIALDEELIGVSGKDQKQQLLEELRPQFIILKPTLLGGLAATAEWIEIAENLNTGWWVTSALESNIGLNAIAQFTASYPVMMPQGLGTGQLYRNNIASPLYVKNGYLHWQPDKDWDLSVLKF